MSNDDGARLESVPDEQGPRIPSHEMSETERRETLTDTFASFALDGMYPTPLDLSYAREYIAGRISLEQIIEETRTYYDRSRPER